MEACDMRRRIPVFVVAFVGAYFFATGLNAVSANTGEDSLIARYQTTLTKLFLTLKNSAVPVYLASYKIADTWDSSMSRLVESGDRCFKNLNTRIDRDTIPNVTFREEAAIGLLFRIK